MELVEGEDLAQRLARGPQPVADALAVAKQIAEALEAAHEQGIIHRDLKPANIKVRDDGAVKVLDFGLAKAMEPAAGSSPSVSMSPTLSIHATEAGIILGTAAYMAPEQARGSMVDRRADLWAFGVVLYEMLTGARLFEGPTVSDTLAHVLTKEPDWHALPAATPPGIRKLLRRLLDRDRKRRLDSAAAARHEIDEALTSPAEAVPDPKAKKARSPLYAVAFVTVGMAVGVAVATIGLPRSGTAEHPVRALQIIAGDGIQTPRISPDGKNVTFIRRGKLFVRPLDSFDARELDGTDEASRPFWSPDSQSIGYFVSPGELRTISIKGGKSRLIATDVFAPFGGAWCGDRLLFIRWAKGLWSTQGGGEPQLFMPAEGNTLRDQPRFPSCLPDGRVIAVWDQSIVVADGKQRSTVYESKDAQVIEPVYVTGNTLAFQTLGANSGISVISVNAGVSAATSAPTLVLPDATYPSVSANGQLIALTGIRNGPHQLVWVDRAGKQVSTFGRPQTEFLAPAVAGDGSRVAVSSPSSSGSLGVWIHRETTAQPFAMQEASPESVAWSPSGDRIAYDAETADQSGGRRIFIRATNGSGEARLIVQGEYPVWTPDGQSLIFQRGYKFRDRDKAINPTLWITSLVEGAAPRRLVENAFEASISPDGRMLAYTSGAGDQSEVYVAPLASPGDAVPVSSNAGRFPRWSPRGGELFYLAGPTAGADPNSRRDVFAAQIDSRGPLKVTRNEKLFDAEALGGSP